MSTQDADTVVADLVAEVKELRRLARNLASALRTGENQARSEALAQWAEHIDGIEDER